MLTPMQDKHNDYSVSAPPVALNVEQSSRPLCKRRTRGGRDIGVGPDLDRRRRVPGQMAGPTMAIRPRAEPAGQVFKEGGYREGWQRKTHCWPFPGASTPSGLLPLLGRRRRGPGGQRAVDL